MCRFALTSIDNKVACVQNNHCQIKFSGPITISALFISFTHLYTQGQVESSQGWGDHKWRSWRLHSNKSTWFGQLKTTEAPKPGGGQPCPLQKSFLPVIGPGGPRLSWACGSFALACLSFPCLLPWVLCTWHLWAPAIGATLIPVCSYSIKDPVWNKVTARGSMRGQMTFCLHTYVALNYLFTSCLFCGAGNWTEGLAHARWVLHPWASSSSSIYSSLRLIPHSHD